jgi:AcrR family transcriptional regulator
MSRAERGAQTRQRLLDATIECLAELGYANMSTNDVVRKTGVTRGALAHHFPSKAFLVAEAAAYLISRRIKYTVSKIKSIEKSDHDFRRQIETNWKAYEKWFPANIEFMVASRTDPELRAHFSKAIGRYEKELSELQMDHFSQGRIPQYVVGCFVRGLCLERLVNSDDLIDEIFEEFVRIMDIAFPVN